MSNKSTFGYSAHLTVRDLIYADKTLWLRLSHCSRCDLFWKKNALKILVIMSAQ